MRWGGARWGASPARVVRQFDRPNSAEPTCVPAGRRSGLRYPSDRHETAAPVAPAARLERGPGEVRGEDGPHGAPDAPRLRRRRALAAGEGGGNHVGPPPVGADVDSPQETLPEHGEHARGGVPGPVCEGPGHSRRGGGQAHLPGERPAPGVAAPADPHRHEAASGRARGEGDPAQREHVPMGLPRRPGPGAPPPLPSARRADHLLGRGPPSPTRGVQGGAGEPPGLDQELHRRGVRGGVGQQRHGASGGAPEDLEGSPRRVEAAEVGAQAGGERVGPRSKLGQHDLCAGCAGARQHPDGPHGRGRGVRGGRVQPGERHDGAGERCGQRPRQVGQVEVVQLERGGLQAGPEGPRHAEAEAGRGGRRGR